MEVVAKLMNKLGKLPKERLCMQDIGLSDIQVTTFLQHCVTFLDIFIDVRRKLYKLLRDKYVRQNTRRKLFQF